MSCLFVVLFCVRIGNGMNLCFLVKIRIEMFRVFLGNLLKNVFSKVQNTKYISRNNHIVLVYICSSGAIVSGPERYTVSRF